MTRRSTARVLTPATDATVAQPVKPLAGAPVDDAGGVSGSAKPTKNARERARLRFKALSLFSLNKKDHGGAGNTGGSGKTGAAWRRPPEPPTPEMLKLEAHFFKSLEQVPRLEDNEFHFEEHAPQAHDAANQYARVAPPAGLMASVPVPAGSGEDVPSAATAEKATPVEHEDGAPPLAAGEQARPVTLDDAAGPVASADGFTAASATKAAPPPKLILQAISANPQPPSVPATPVTAAPAATPGAQAEEQILPGKTLQEKFGTLRGNQGGGSCMFHAYMGVNLSIADLIVLRGRVADVKRRPGDEREETLNAHHLVAGMSQTPFIGRKKADEWMLGRHLISNEVYANFQALPRAYAGEDELCQLTSLPDQAGNSVLVIDEEGMLARFANGVRSTVAREDLEAQVLASTHLLYKTYNHWMRIIPSDEWT